MSLLSSAWRWVMGLAWMAFVCVTIILCSAILPPGRYEGIVKALLRGLFRVLGIPVRVRGAHRLGKAGPRLYMCNHVSLFDVPLLGGFLPGSLRGVEWRPHFRWPLYGLAIRRLGNIPIDRDDAFSSMQSLRRARRRIRAGQSFLIMPEGHRTRDGALGPFKRMPFVLARQAGVDLVPVGISGLFQLHRKGSWRIRSSRLVVSVGAPIPAASVKKATPAELRDLTRRRIAELIERP